MNINKSILKNFAVACFVAISSISCTMSRPISIDNIYEPLASFNNDDNSILLSFTFPDSYIDIVDYEIKITQYGSSEEYYLYVFGKHLLGKSSLNNFDKHSKGLIQYRENRVFIKIPFGNKIISSDYLCLSDGNSINKIKISKTK